jgi:hypothetical protein
MLEKPKSSLKLLLLILIVLCLGGCNKCSNTDLYRGSGDFEFSSETRLKTIESILKDLKASGATKLANEQKKSLTENLKALINGIQEPVDNKIVDLVVKSFEALYVGLVSQEISEILEALFSEADNQLCFSRLLEYMSITNLEKLEKNLNSHNGALYNAVKKVLIEKKAELKEIIDKEITETYKTFYEEIDSIKKNKKPVDAAVTDKFAKKFSFLLSCLLEGDNKANIKDTAFLFKKMLNSLTDKNKSDDLVKIVNEAYKENKAGFKTLLETSYYTNDESSLYEVLDKLLSVLESHKSSNKELYDFIKEKIEHGEDEVKNISK